MMLALSSNVFAGTKLAASVQTLDFSSSNRIQYFSLSNHGDEKAFIKIEVKAVSELGKENSQTRDATKNEIITVPKKLILKQGQSRKIKVLKRMSAQSSDQFFRIYSSTAPLPSKKKELEDKDAVGLKLHVGIGTNTLVVVRPKAMHPNLKMTKSGKNLVIENTGNTTIKIQKIKQCEGEDCISYASKTVFPGNKRTITLKNASRPVSLTQNTAGTEKEHLVS